MKVPDAEQQFQMNGMDALACTQNPVIYISPVELYNTHQLILDVSTELFGAGRGVADPLQELLKLMKPPKEFVSVLYFKSEGGEDEELVGAEEGRSGDEISLTLTSQIVDKLMGAQNATSGLLTEYRNLFIETKRNVLLLIRSGARVR